MAGLGLAGSAGDNGRAGSSVWPNDCVTEANFLTSLNALTTGSLLNLDGTVVQSAALNTGRLVPCISTAPAVTIGGIAGTVTYAGWVPDSIAGLYQVNVTLPGRTAGSCTTTTGAPIITIPAPRPTSVILTAPRP